MGSALVLCSPYCLLADGRFIWQQLSRCQSAFLLVPPVEMDQRPRRCFPACILSAILSSPTCCLAPLAPFLPFSGVLTAVRLRAHRILFMAAMARLSEVLSAIVRPASPAIEGCDQNKLPHFNVVVLCVAELRDLFLLAHRKPDACVVRGWFVSFTWQTPPAIVPGA